MMIKIKGKIGDLKTKDGIVFDFKGEVSPSDDELIALRHLQQAPEVVFTIEPAVEQQSLPLDKPAAVVDVPGQVKLHIENVRCRRGGPEADLCGQCPTPPNECELFMAAPRSCPGCGTSMDKVAGGRRCPRCGLGVTVDGEVTSAETTEASGVQADEGEEDAEEEPEQTEAVPPGGPDEFAGLSCPECGSPMERVIDSETGAAVLECTNWNCLHTMMSEAEARMMLEQESCPEDAHTGAEACGRRRWIDPATGKVYEIGQGIGDGWGLFERKANGSSRRVKAVEYKYDRQAVERAAVEYAKRRGWQEVDHDDRPFRPAVGE